MLHSGQPKMQIACNETRCAAFRTCAYDTRILITVLYVGTMPGLRLRGLPVLDTLTRLRNESSRRATAVPRGASGGSGPCEGDPGAEGEPGRLGIFSSCGGRRACLRSMLLWCAHPGAAPPTLDVLPPLPVRMRVR